MPLKHIHSRRRFMPPGTRWLPPLDKIQIKQHTPIARQLSRSIIEEGRDGHARRAPICTPVLRIGC